MTGSVEVKMIKSPIPIIWLDTSIIFKMTQWKCKLGKLDDSSGQQIPKLYDQIYNCVRSGKVICPLAEQEAEVWIERDKFFDTIHSLSLGIETKTLQTIHDMQFHIFILTGNLLMR